MYTKEQDTGFPIKEEPKESLWARYKALPKTYSRLHNRVFYYLQKYANKKSLTVTVYPNLLARSLQEDEDDIQWAIADFIRDGIVKQTSTKGDSYKLRLLLH